MTVLDKIKLARNASLEIRNYDEHTRNTLLSNIIIAINKYSKDIIASNKLDLVNAINNNLAKSLYDRLIVNEKKINEICTMLNAVIAQPDLMYQTILNRELDTGLTLSKRYVPLGVIGMIFESRPDAMVQMAALCLKTGNSVLLKGGSEAIETNTILYKIIVAATKQKNSDWIQLLVSREDVGELIRGTGDESVDIVIPRGGQSFVKQVMEVANVPVLGHAEGVCHIYLHPKANLEQSKKIIYDSKLQYPAVCNSLECLLVDDQALIFLPAILKPLSDAGVILYVDEEIEAILTSAKIPFTQAGKEHWGVEFSDKYLSLRTVDNVEEAVAHVNKYGSGHTDVILTEDEGQAQYFQQNVDSATVGWNCSTRFADGYRYGLGAEVGISTSKIHARGPVGVEGLFSTQWVLNGKGQIVAPYVDGTKSFTHKDISISK